MIRIVLNFQEWLGSRVNSVNKIQILWGQCYMWYMQLWIYVKDNLQIEDGIVCLFEGC